MYFLKKWYISRVLILQLPTHSNLFLCAKSTGIRHGLHDEMMMMTTRLWLWLLVFGPPPPLPLLRLMRHGVTKVATTVAAIHLPKNQISVSLRVCATHMQHTKCVTWAPKNPKNTKTKKNTKRMTRPAAISFVL